MSIVVNVNMSLEVAEYFKDHDLSQVANTLLEMYDFTNLPPVQGTRAREYKVTIENETYIQLYNTLGPRSKKLSLGRLFEFAYNMDVLDMPRFEEARVLTRTSPVHSLVDRAYRALLQAQKHDASDELRQITNLVYDYREVTKWAR